MYLEFSGHPVSNAAWVMRDGYDCLGDYCYTNILVFLVLRKAFERFVRWVSSAKVLK